MVALEALTPSSVPVLWISSKLNWAFLHHSSKATDIPADWGPFYATLFFLPLNSPLLCLNVAVCEASLSGNDLLKLALFVKSVSDGSR